MNINEEFEKKRLLCGRRISATKTAPKGQICIWNSNAIIKSQGKVWYGDINITKEGEKLKEIAKEIGEPIYILEERDCRFGKDEYPIDILIKWAVWNTDEP